MQDLIIIFKNGNNDRVNITRHYLNGSVNLPCDKIMYHCDHGYNENLSYDFIHKYATFCGDDVEMVIFTTYILF